MNLKDPVTAIMSERLIVVNPNDEMLVVRNRFEEHSVHHLLVEHDRELHGVLSLGDFRFFQRNFTSEGDRLIAESRLRAYKVKEIMTPVNEIVTLQVDSTIKEALLIFKENRFHCIPIMDEGRLAGIVTTHDIIKNLLKEEE